MAACSPMPAKRHEAIRALSAYAMEAPNHPDHARACSTRSRPASRRRRSSRRRRPGRRRCSTASARRSAPTKAPSCRPPICSSPPISMPRAILPLMALGDILSGADSAATRRSPSTTAFRIARGSAAAPTSRPASASTCSTASTRRASHIKRVVDANPADLDAVMALGNHLSRPRDVSPKPPTTYTQRHRHDRRPSHGRLAHLLFPRRLATSAASAGREAEADFKQALAIKPEPAAGAQLSRLFLGRHGRSTSTRRWHDQDRGRSPAERRLHRRQPRLGLLPARPLRRGGRASSSARSSCGRRIRSSTIISATPSGGSGASSRRRSSGAMPATSIPSRKRGTRSSRSSKAA